LRFEIGLLLFGSLLAGCDASDASESPAAAPRAVSGNGIIRGAVKFAGAAPEMKASQVQCHDGPVEVVDESVVVNGNGTLRNVFVYLEGAPATGDGPAKQAALLDQVSCKYVPHAVAVQVGQALRVRSSDATLHNVHSLARANRPFNLSMTRAGDEKSVTFARHEIAPLKCDVHPWMLAYVGVFENPWFAVTDDSGSFEIKNVPEGSYQLVAWHERYGRLEQEVWVWNDRPLDVRFEYKQP
jgi:plastocyanin